MTDFKQTLQQGDTLTVTVPPSTTLPPPPTGGPAPLPTGIHLTLVNVAGVSPSDVVAYLSAQQAQIDNDFSPAWGGSAVIDQQAGGWPVYLMTSSDVREALGYHDVDGTGLPFARVFLVDAAAAGVPWQAVASHEVLEMLADANANTTDLGPDGCQWYQEVGDPVEDLSYSVEGVPLSDFALPVWWVLGSAGPWDHLGVLHAPFTTTPGGYAVENCGGTDQIALGAKQRTGSVDRAYR